MNTSSLRRIVDPNDNNHPDAEPDLVPNWIHQHVMPTLSEAYDTNSLKPTIRILQCPPDSGWMNNNDTIVIQPDQLQPKTEDTTSQTCAVITPLSPPKEGHKATENTIRLMKQARVLASVTNDNVRVHVDGGPNRSITNNKNHYFDTKI